MIYENIFTADNNISRNKNQPLKKKNYLVKKEL